MSSEAEDNEQLQDSIKAYGLKQEVNRIHKEMMSSMSARSKQPGIVRSIGRSASRVAATLLIFIIGVTMYLYFSSTTDNLYNDQYVPFEASSVRSDEKENSEAIKYFNQGKTSLDNGQPAVAIDYFGKLLEYDQQTGNAVLKDDAEYYLALAYLKNDQPDKSLELFKRIHNDPNHLYQDEISGWNLLKLKVLSWKNKK
jgi:tetratricopeptide (TPR) repeat protein